MSGEPAFGSAWSASFRRGSEAELRGWVEAALGWCDATESPGSTRTSSTLPGIGAVTRPSPPAAPAAPAAASR